MVGRTYAFIPDGLNPGPPLQSLLANRKTCAKVIGTRGELVIVDEWASTGDEPALDQEWTGRTIFYKSSAGVAPATAVAAGIKPELDLYSYDANDPDHGGDAGKRVHLWEACCSTDCLLGRVTSASKDLAVTRLT